MSVRFAPRFGVSVRVVSMRGLSVRVAPLCGISVRGTAVQMCLSGSLSDKGVCKIAPRGRLFLSAATRCSKSAMISHRCGVFIRIDPRCGVSVRGAQVLGVCQGQPRCKISVRVTQVRSFCHGLAGAGCV